MTQGNMSGLQATVERIDALFAEMRRLPKRHAETTIFNIGGRGYYENATSDVLAFFLDPKREHGFETTVLESLLSAAGIDDADFELTHRPQREYETSGGNRIDILLEGRNHVLIIENKIRHAANNPFPDYERTVREIFPDKKPLLVLLTYRDEPVDERDEHGKELPAHERKWKTARYQDVVKALRERMGDIVMDRPYTKWTMLLREFVLTLEEEMADEKREQALVDFGTKNAASLFEAADLLETFIKLVSEQALLVVATVCGTSVSECGTRSHTWAAARSIRLLYPKRWGESNITLHVMLTGGFRCVIYAHGFPESEHERVKGVIRFGNFESRKLNASACFAGNLSSELPDMEQTKALIEKCAEKLNLLYPLPPADAARPTET